MAHVVVLGGGVVGLSTAMMLAKDGHEVTVLERDPAPPPTDIEAAWGDWQRRGVNQFHQLHFFLARFRQIISDELPEVLDALIDVGALRYNIISNIPDEMKGGSRPDDDQFETITGRRPVVEATVAQVAAKAPGVTIRRGVAVAGLVSGVETVPGVPHIVGVRTDAGEEIRADLVIDVSGRRSALPSWLAALGAQAPVEELEDCGFVYYGRYFRSSDGSIPAMFGPLLLHIESISVLTLPADNGTWGVGIVASARDAALRRLSDVDAWTRVAKSFPLTAHWLDGEPMNDSVAVMAKIEDRHRSFVTDGRPVATGVLAVADAWACTNPSLGRGVSIGLTHAVALRDLVRTGIADPYAVALEWDAVTQRTVEPMYRSTLDFDRHRLAEVDAHIAGREFPSVSPSYEVTRSLEAAAGQDPDLLRAFMKVAGLLATPEEVFSEPGVLDKAVALGANWRESPLMGPSRAELLSLVGA